MGGSVPNMMAMKNLENKVKALLELQKKAEEAADPEDSVAETMVDSPKPAPIQTETTLEKTGVEVENEEEKDTEFVVAK